MDEIGTSLSLPPYFPFPTTQVSVVVVSHHREDISENFYGLLFYPLVVTLSTLLTGASPPRRFLKRVIDLPRGIRWYGSTFSEQLWENTFALFFFYTFFWASFDLLRTPDAFFVELRCAQTTRFGLFIDRSVHSVSRDLTSISFIPIWTVSPSWGIRPARCASSHFSG